LREHTAMKPNYKIRIIFILLICSFFVCNNQHSIELPNTISCTDPVEIHSGVATYYDFADGSGNCCFPPTPDDLMVGAMNHTDYDNSYACGSCVEIDGPEGKIQIRIVDQCPECKDGHIDLSPLAFSKIAPLEHGVVPISWKRIPCKVNGPIVYHFKAGCNPWWIAIQVRNHRNPVLKLEFGNRLGIFSEIPRTTYNYFIKGDGLGSGPFVFRVTDLFGHQLTDTISFPPNDTGEVSGKGQFPLCGEEN